MSKEIVVSQSTSTLPTREEIEVIQFMVKSASDSKYFEKMGGAAGIMTIALYAREIGLPIMSALMGGLQNIMGKITMSPETMNSLIRQNGHKLKIETSPTGCQITGTRKDTGETYTASFTIEDARKAGLIKAGGGYEKYAEDMCFARCISRLRRRLFPDVANRSYVHGELEDADAEVSENPSHQKAVDPEAITIPAITVISSEEATKIDQEIAKNIDPVAPEYRKQILGFLGIDSLEKIPVAKLKSIQNSMEKKIKTLKEAAGVPFARVEEPALVQTTLV